jgi:energy-coupling factor transporter ATP-binding protein EcfA2
MERRVSSPLIGNQVIILDEPFANLDLHTIPT